MVQRRQAVTVDQKALVSKILARYNTAFAPLREMVQNADDAGATVVSIKLLLDEAAPVPGGPLVKCLTVSNNGRPFSEADWSRVSRIASGNPDGAAVGLFGVGFFAVFGLTDEPEIRSGSAAMRFAHEGDGFFSYHDELPQPVNGAQFSMRLKPGSDAAHWAEADELARLRRVLASMLLFARSITSITLEAPGCPPLHLSREARPLRTAPAEHRGAGGPPPMFALRQLELSQFTLRARWLDPAPGGPGGPGPAQPAAGEPATLCMIQVSAAAEARKGGGRAKATLAELQEKFGKPMPESARLSLLYTTPHAAPPAAGPTAAAGPDPALEAALAGLRCERGEPGLVYVGVGAMEQCDGGHLRTWCGSASSADHR